MENETLKAVRSALNRAGFVCINPPPFFVAEVCPALWAGNTAVKSLAVNPACPVKRKRMADRLGRIARALNWFAAVRRGGLPEDQAEELENVAKEIAAAAALLNPARHA